MIIKSKKYKNYFVNYLNKKTENTNIYFKMSGGQLSESVNNVVDKVVDNTKAVINNAMNVDPFVTNDPITTVVSFFKCF